MGEVKKLREVKVNEPKQEKLSYEKLEAVASQLSMENMNLRKNMESLKRFDVVLTLVMNSDKISNQELISKAEQEVFNTLYPAVAEQEDFTQDSENN